jgi:hypothetical protein
VCSSDLGGRISHSASGGSFIPCRAVKAARYRVEIYVRRWVVDRDAVGMAVVLVLVC